MGEAGERVISNGSLEAFGDLDESDVPEDWEEGVEDCRGQVELEGLSAIEAGVIRFEITGFEGVVAGSESDVESDVDSTLQSKQQSNIKRILDRHVEHSSQ